MMKPLPRLFLAFVGLCLMAPGLAAGQADFFRPAPDRAADYAADKVYPQGRIFPFSFFSAPTDLAAQAGVTLTGPWYGKPESVLKMVDEAQQAGIPAIYTLQARNAEGEPIGLAALAEADLDQAVESIRQQVREVLKSDRNAAVAWWYLQPEELRYWRKHELEYLDRATDAIRETDPQGRPIWMYDPGHRTAAALARTAEHLDIVGKGMYTNYSGQQDSRVWVRWTMEQELGAIEQANPDAIAIAVPEMFQQPDAEHLPHLRDWVRHDVYLSLVHGAEGVVIFSLGRRANFPARLAYYEAYAEVCRELTGELNLGQVFLFGERRNDLSVNVTDGPATVELTYPKNAEKPMVYPSVSPLDVAHGGDRYLFLVNSANDPVTLSVTGLPAGAPARVTQPWAEEEAAFDAAGGRFDVTLAPLEVKLYQFHPAGQ